MYVDHLERLLESLPVVPWALSVARNGTVHWIYAPPALLELWGAERSELDTHPGLFVERIHPDDQGSYFEAAARAGLEVDEYAWSGRIVRRDGSIRSLESRARITDGEDGQRVWYGFTLVRSA